MIVTLDAGPLGNLCNPRPNSALTAWMDSGLAAGAEFVVSEAADFEVRRELLRANLELSLARLDRLASKARVVPVTTEIWLSAAHLWAESRNRGRPTADPKELDIDVLLAATALSLQNEGDVVVATTNVGHLSQFVDARVWSDITFP